MRGGQHPDPERDPGGWNRRTPSAPGCGLADRPSSVLLGHAWNALPTGQSSWSLPIPSGARFQVAFRCPSVSGTDFYVSLDLMRSEVGTNLLVRCPVAYASSPATVSGNVSPPLGSGTAFSAWGAASFTGGSFAGLTAPTGPGREVAVFGDSGGTPYFGRTGPVTIPPLAVSVPVSPTVPSTSPPRPVSSLTPASSSPPSYRWTWSLRTGRAREVPSPCPGPVPSSAGTSSSSGPATALAAPSCARRQRPLGGAGSLPQPLRASFKPLRQPEPHPKRPAHL